MGLSPGDDLQTTRLDDLLTPESACHSHNVELPTVMARRCYSGEGQMRRLETGGPVDVETCSFLIEPAHSGAGACVGIVRRDLTDRRRFEASARVTDERFRQMAEHIDEVFWIVAIQPFEVLYVSPAYTRHLGSSLPAVVQPSGVAFGRHPPRRSPAVRGQFSATWPRATM